MRLLEPVVVAIERDAPHARPIALRNGALEVAVDSSVWCQTLRLRAPELLDALAQALGDDAPRALWLRLG